MTEKNNVKIVFMGTPDFAVPPFNALVEAGYDVRLAVTQPDRPKGRGKKLHPTPVKEAAEKAGVKVIQPARIKENEEFFEELRAADPDLVIVAAYGKILPKTVLDIPELGCVNIHASLLPRFRGAAPIQRCIIEGDEKTGVTLMYMAEGMDTGDMIARAETSTAGKTAGELTEELSVLGAELLVEQLPAIVAGEVIPEVQDDSLATYSPMVEKSEGRLDFSRDAYELERLVRGLSPSPGTFTEYKGVRMKIKSADVIESGFHEQPGTILSADEDGIAVACSQNTFVIRELQMPGKKPAKAADYLRGNPIEKGEVFGQ